MPHKDGPGYCPQAVILSLGAPAMIHFWRSLADTKKKNNNNTQEGENGGRADEDEEDGACLSLYLRPRSLLIFTGVLYTDCFHGIEVNLSIELCVCVKPPARRVRPRIRSVPWFVLRVGPPLVVSQKRIYIAFRLLFIYLCCELRRARATRRRMWPTWSPARAATRPRQQSKSATFSNGPCASPRPPRRHLHLCLLVHRPRPRHRPPPRCGVAVLVVLEVLAWGLAASARSQACSRAFRLPFGASCPCCKATDLTSQLLHPPRLFLLLPPLPLRLLRPILLQQHMLLPLFRLQLLLLPLHLHRDDGIRRNDPHKQ